MPVKFHHKPRDPAYLEDRARKREREPQMHPYASVRKADTKLATDIPLEHQDQFMEFYKPAGEASLIKPPFNPLDLKSVVERNNILPQCIDVMEVNVDGTDHTVELIEGMTENEAEKKNAEDFFKEPFPEMSMVDLRRKVRRDRESIGWGVIEFVRDATGELVLLRYIDAALVRMVRLDAVIEKQVTITRRGKEITVTMPWRERRFATVVGSQLRYYREYGATRQIDKNTGMWAKPGEELALDVRGSELMYFPCMPDATTPYGVPRWINNLPSALGSRKAEEFNLEFFDSGGLPPVIAFIMNGGMGDTTATQLRHFLSGRAATHQRGAVVEIQSTSGSIDGRDTPPTVKIERFGDTKTGDSQFQNYDKNTEDHVRVAFRIAPIFLGRATDYNFATAIAAILVTEAQVFQPERTAFDQTMTRTVLKELGIKNYAFKSKPMLIQNSDLQMKALEFAKGQVSGEELIETLNQICNLNLKYDQATVDAQAALEQPPMIGPDGKPMAPPKGPPQGLPDKRPEAGTGKPDSGVTKRWECVQKSVEHYGAMDVLSLHHLWSESRGLIASAHKFTPVEKTSIEKQVRNLTGEWRVYFDTLCRDLYPSYDENMRDIMGCCVDLMLQADDA